MKYIEAPAEFDGNTPSIFLAGGITACDDGQPRMAALLADSDLVVLNPRRKSFPIHDPNAAEEQIAWEFRHLRKAAAKVFWFPPQTLCPISLYELGAWSMTKGPLFVGVDPAYQRRRDVEIQTRLVRPDVLIVGSLDELVNQVLEWSRNKGQKP